MEKTLFLGAGASKFAGMPTTKDLVRNVRERVIQHEKLENHMAGNLAINIVYEHTDKDVEVLYQTIHNMIDAEKCHKTVVRNKTKSVSGLGWKREIQITRGYDSDNADKKVVDEANDIDETIRTLESLEVAIRNTLLTNLTVRLDHRDDVVSTYDKLFQHTCHNVVTTNYDNVLEYYCERKKIDLLNGFKKSHLGDMRIWDDVWEGKECALKLNKIHGSITWQKDDDGAVLEVSRPGLRGTDRDVMIAPTLGEKDYSSDIFPKLLNRFKDTLTKTYLLIVIGLSFRDGTINQMLLDRLKRTEKNPCPMRLLYIDINPDGLKKLIPNCESREVTVPGKCKLVNYSQSEIPYVYAFESEFDLEMAGRMKNVLEGMDKVCDGT